MKPFRIASVAVTAMLVMGLSAETLGVVTTVTPANMQGWGFLQEIANGSGSLVFGPGTPPLGTGSAELTVDGTGRQILGTTAFNGKRLDLFEKINYWTYSNTTGGTLAISLQFNIDYDLTDADNSWQGRLVFEPVNDATQGPVQDGVWQQWDALAGNWWASGAPGSATFGISSPTSISDILSQFPNAGIHATLGAVLFKAGGPWTNGFTGSVDAFTVQFPEREEQTFDFEAVPAPGAAVLAMIGLALVRRPRRQNA